MLLAERTARTVLRYDKWFWRREVMINYAKDVWMVEFQADIEFPRESVKPRYVLNPFQCKLNATVITLMDEEDTSLCSLGKTAFNYPFAILRHKLDSLVLLKHSACVEHSWRSAYGSRFWSLCKSFELNRTARRCDSSMRLPESAWWK